MTYNQAKSIYKQKKQNRNRKLVRALFLYLLNNYKFIIIKGSCLVYLFLVQPRLTALWAGDNDMMCVISTVNIVAACLLLFYRKERNYE